MKYITCGKGIFGIIVLLACLFSASHLFAQTINVGKLSAAPTLDGNSSDWSGVNAVTVPLFKTKPDGKTNVKSVSVRSGVFGDQVYFLLQWEDSTHDAQHKPFVWNASKNKYETGPQREDRLAIQFAMEGDYTFDWFSGKSFTADMWHWKAARSNPAMLVHDKMTIIGTDKVKKAFKATARNGQTIYIQRPSDKGGPLYTTKRYRSKEKDVMPKYIVNAGAIGSIADIKARGVWKDGMWTLEIQRKLNTGHSDDVVFVPGTAVKGGISIFNRTGDDDHTTSKILTFQF